MADVTLHPDTDGTYAIATRGSSPEATRKLRRAGIGHFLGFDPKAADDRAKVEARITELGLTVAWGEARATY